MDFIVSHFKRLDWILIITAMLLSGIGLVFLYSSCLGGGDFYDFQKQFIFLLIGISLMFGASFFDWRNLKEDSRLILVLYFICIAALAGILLFAPEIRGIKAWYKIGPVSFDPIEITKIVLVILLAKYFSNRHIEMYRARHIIFSGFYFLFPILLIFFHPDLGSVLILSVLWLGMLIVSGIPLRHFLALLACAVLAFSLCWATVLKDYQRERILSFVNPIDPLGMSWNQNQAKIAIGSGGVWGQGIGKGSQTQYGFLPETRTDFIFASIAEETGLAGVGVLLSLFFILLWRIIKISLLSENNFSRLFSAGIAILIVSQIFIHIGMNIGLLPIIGISLPFVSYGGSGLIMFFLAIGILQSIRMR